MLVHKGGQINNVQLISGVMIAEMSQLQNCSAMCINNGSYYENEKNKREKVRGGGDMYKEWKRGGVGRGGGQGGCEWRSEVFVKIQKK